MSQVTYLAGLRCRRPTSSCSPGPCWPAAWGQQQPAEGWRRMAMTSLSLSDSLSDSRLSLAFLFLSQESQTNATQVARTEETSWVCLNLCLQSWHGRYRALYTCLKSAGLIMAFLTEGTDSVGKIKQQLGPRRLISSLPGVRPAVCMFPQLWHAMCMYVGLSVYVCVCVCVCVNIWTGKI